MTPLRRSEFIDRDASGELAASSCRRKWFVLAGSLFGVVASASAADPDARGEVDHWPQWRGAGGSGVAAQGDPPVRWSEGSNVRWKTAIPGLGHSTPIIWGERVFLTTAEAYGEAVGTHVEHDHGAHDNLPSERKQRFEVVAINRRDGSIAWRRTVRDERPHEGVHETGSWASNSPVTDGEHLFAHFGSRGIFCLDMEGRVVWERDLGDMRARHGHGEGSSPALYGDTLVVNWDHEGDSFITALDKRTGKPLWKTPRDEMTSWSTPLIVEHDGRVQVVVSATGRIRAYDLKSGREIWNCAGLSRNVVASPVAADGIVYAGNSYDHRALLAIRLGGAKGDVTGTAAVVWSTDRHTPYVPSPLLYDGVLYNLKHSHGFLTRRDAKTGEVHYGPVRLPEIAQVFASPVGAAGRIYIPARNGKCAVITHGAVFNVLAVNTLDDSFSASPAVAGDELYLRGERSLYCIATPGIR